MYDPLVVDTQVDVALGHVRAWIHRFDPGHFEQHFALFHRRGYALAQIALDDQSRKRRADFGLREMVLHQLQPRFRYVHTWAEGDVLMWDHIRTIHMALADYGPEEHRHMLRCRRRSR